jgi:hypothetical protein
MFSNRYIFTWNEAVAIELKAGFLIIGALGMIIKCPTPTASVYQVADLVLLSWPESLDAASLTQIAPLAGNEVSLVVERSCKLVSANTAPIGKFVIARKF